VSGAERAVRAAAGVFGGAVIGSFIEFRVTVALTLLAMGGATMVPE